MNMTSRQKQLFLKQTEYLLKKDALKPEDVECICQIDNDALFRESWKEYVEIKEDL